MVLGHVLGTHDVKIITQVTKIEIWMQVERKRHTS